jgi:hypothetical protein
MNAILHWPGKRQLAAELDQPWQRPAPSKRRQEPASLRNAWSTWWRQHPNASHAEAATALHVAEATLLAALDGAGVTLLRPDLAGLLAPAASWDRFVVEIEHPLGRACLDMKPESVRIDEDCLILQDGPQRVLLSTQGIAHCYLVAAQAPGCYGLHWFNADGDVVARVHLPADAAQHLAVLHLLQFTQPESRRPHLPVLTRAPALQVRPSWCAIDAMVKTDQAVTRLSGAIGAALQRTPRLQFSIEGRGAALSYCGPTAQVLTESANTSHTHPAGRLFLHTDMLTHAFVCVAPDGTPFLRLHGDAEGNIALQPELDSVSAAWAWIDQIVPERR